MVGGHVVILHLSFSLPLLLVLVLSEFGVVRRALHHMTCCAKLHRWQHSRASCTLEIPSAAREELDSAAPSQHVSVRDEGMHGA